MNENGLNRAIKEYNKYRSPLVKAKLLKLEENKLEVEFEGYFCYSCGMDEYFVDLIYELESNGVDAELLEFHRKEDEKFIVQYKFT